MLEFINTLFEGTSKLRIPHPEDAIFDGGDAAKRYIDALVNVIADPSGISIKWDGGIALIFGIDPTGKFFINDKYMPAGFYAHSPKDWQYYDTDIKKSGTTRGDLYGKLGAIWAGLNASVVEPGIYKGDLMTVSESGSLPLTQGAYQFTGPTVTYRIQPNTAMGKLVTGKNAILVVHQRNGEPWDGKTGLANNGSVAIINPTAGLQFKLSEPTQLVASAEKAKDLIPEAEQFLLGMDGVARDKLRTYFNKKITQQTRDDAYTWMAANASGSQARKLLGDNKDGYLYTNANGYEALRTLWNAVYQLKVNLTIQLEQQVTGFEQTVGGQRAGEGFVFNTPDGLVKLVNRGVFGVAHFNK
jgi:hypothetical protein